MIQSGRNRLYNLACRIDNLPRVRIPPTKSKPTKVSREELDKARFKGQTKDMYVVSGDELEDIANQIREIVAWDGGAV